MREHAIEAAPEAAAGRPRDAEQSRSLPAALGNRAMAALASGAVPPRGARGMGRDLQRLVATSPPVSTSPPNMARPEEAALIEGLELTSPWDYFARAYNWAFGSSAAPAAPSTSAPTPPASPPAPTPPAAPAAPAVPVQNPTSLTVKGSGSIEGTYGISQYWPVTNYWGADKTLGAFDEPISSSPGWRMKGHKFQVVGEFSNGTTTTGAGGTVQFLQ